MARLSHYDVLFAGQCLVPKGRGVSAHSKGESFVIYSHHMSENGSVITGQL